MAGNIQQVLEIFSQLIEGISKHPGYEEQAQRVKNFRKSVEDLMGSDIFATGNQAAGSFVVNFLIAYQNSLKSLVFSAKVQKKSRKIKILLLIEKIDLLVRSLTFAFNLPFDDFEFLPEDHPRKKALDSVTSTFTEDSKTIAKQVSGFIKQYNQIKATFFTACKFKSSKSRDLLTTSLLMYYSMFTKKCNKIIAKSSTSNKIDSLCQLWNVTETPVLKKLLPATFPSIPYKTQIYLPRLSPLITDSQAPPPDQQHYIDLINQEPLLAGAKYTFSPDPQNLRIPVLVLSKSPLHKIKHEQIREHKKSCFTSNPSGHTKYEKIIIHVHGGGFIGQSPFSHQNYTRAWVNELDVPVFSIEYRLAPKNKFPDGLDDVWQAYTWIVKYAHRYLGIVPHKIVLAGDSAGGNFIIGICIKAISCGFRVPDGLLLVYPAVNFIMEDVSIGRLLSLEDPILTFRTFLLIIESYLKDPSQAKDPLVSPLYCEDSIIESFPRTKMLVTLNDPLFSDGLRFADKLLRNRVDLEVYKYPEFIHGCMNMIHSNGIPIFQRFLSDSIELLQKLLS